MKSLKIDKQTLFDFTKVGPFKEMPDAQFIRLQYALKMKKDLNLDNPSSYNEKLQWLKLHDRNPLYTKLVDKYAVREFVTNRIGAEYLIPQYGVYESYDAIDFGALPDAFVLKMTHTSGGVYVTKNKDEIDHEKWRKEIDEWLQSNYYWAHREWPYKDVPPRILAEKFMVDESGTDLKDYKFFCFDGEPKMLFVGSQRATDLRFDFFDMSFNHLPVKQQTKNSETEIKKPKGFEEMIKIARKLSKGLPHVRVDLYDINGQIYFGELTFYHNGGHEPFIPDSFDMDLGAFLNLPV